LVKPKLPEAVFLGRVLFRAFTGSFNLVDTYGYTQRWINFFPHFRVSPVVIFFCSIDYRIKRLIMLATDQQVFGFLVHLIAL